VNDRRPFRVVVCALGLIMPFGVVDRSDAQELPVDQEVTPVSEQGVGAEPSPEGLRLNASLGGGWDSNASFEPGGPGSGAAFGQAGIARTWTTPRWTTSINLGGGGSVYQTEAATSRYQLGGGLDTSGQLGTRTTISLGATGGIERTDLLEDPLTAGLVLPITSTRRFQGQVGLGRALGAQTQLSLSAGYGRYYFDAEELSDSEGMNAGAQLSRTISPKSTVSLGYGFQTSLYEETSPSQTHSLSLGFGRTLSPRTSLSLSAGGDQRRVDGVSGGWILSGDAAFILQGSRTSLSLRYSRGVTPAPGLGRDRISNLFSLGLTSRLRPWATLSMSASRGLNQDPVDRDLHYSTDTLSLGLNLRLTQTLGIGPQLRYRRRGEIDDNPAVSSVSVGLALEYATWLR